MSSHPWRSFRPWISAWGARETNASVVSRAFRWAGCATWSATKEQPPQARSGYAPPDCRVRGHVRRVEGAVDDQLAAAVEQVEQAGRAIRAVELVLLLHGHPRHPAALGGQRVAGPRVLLLLHEQLLPRGDPLLRRDDRGGVHQSLLLLQVLVDDIEQAAPQGALAIHPVGRLAEHVGFEREPVGPALDDARHDAGLLQDLQVLGDRRLGHAEAAGGVTDRRRACGQALDDAAADRVRERLERIVNHRVNDSRCYPAGPRLNMPAPHGRAGAERQAVEVAVAGDPERAGEPLGGVARNGPSRAFMGSGGTMWVRTRARAPASRAASAACCGLAW